VSGRKPLDDSAQQQNSPKTSFWHGLSNLFHGHSWNYDGSKVTITVVNAVPAVAGAGLPPAANGKAQAAKAYAENYGKSAKPDPIPTPQPGGEPPPRILPKNDNTRMLKAIEEGLSELSGALSEAASGAVEGFIPLPVWIPEQQHDSIHP
jgi:hypothetical protein